MKYHKDSLRKLAPLLAGALLTAALPTAAVAQSASHRAPGAGYQSFRINLGVLTPRGESRYWDDKAADFTSEADDFSNGAVGIEYLRALGGRLGFVASGNFFVGTEDQAYLDFVDSVGSDIVHTTDIEMAAFTVGLRYQLARRSARVIPYVGAGGGFNAWRLTEVGDFIDFGTEDLEIFFDEFADEGVALGYYVNAGFEIPLGSTVAAYAEGRWTRGEDDLGDDFEGLGELDLSGRTYSAGLSWTF